ncbi:hypothetical protein B0O80DRAFT_116725 [Mortierella sp. GBAus27b]|nr:hypothetical protein B0O80DRAFT_116725 [Mortierella sp. GBAus27b]
MQKRKTDTSSPRKNDGRSLQFRGNKKFKDVVTEQKSHFDFPTWTIHILDTPLPQPFPPFLHAQHSPLPQPMVPKACLSSGQPSQVGSSSIRHGVCSCHQPSRALIFTKADSLVWAQVYEGLVCETAVCQSSTSGTFTPGGVE